MNNYDDLIESKYNEIIEAVKTNKKYFYKTPFATYAILWSDIVAEVCENIDDALHTLFFNKSDADLWLMINNELQAEAAKMAKIIVDIEFNNALQDKAAETLN